MDLTGECRLPASRAAVWAALNDPAVLKACLSGCESLERKPGGVMAAVLVARLGPVKVRFTGEVRIEAVEVVEAPGAPERCSLVGEGKGGLAGSARGRADMHLEEDGLGTVLTYRAEAEVGGGMARIGAPFIESAARKFAARFFAALAAILADASAKAAGGPA